MKGSFKKGFVPKGKDEVKKIEEEPETISNSLVPIISREEMDWTPPLLQTEPPRRVGARTKKTGLNFQHMI